MEDFRLCVMSCYKAFIYLFIQLKAKTELLLSAEAAKAAQKANLENNLEAAQHALQDKQQVGFCFFYN